MIIDIHVHTHRDRDTWDQTLADCRRFNAVPVVSCLGLGEGGGQFPASDKIRTFNDRAAEFCRYAEGRARWFAYLNPQNEDSLDELERCLAMGAAGIKLWISVKTKEDGLTKCEAVLEAIQNKQVPTLIHTWWKTDGTAEGELNVWEFAALARTFPETPLIAAHAGGNWPYLRGALTGLDKAYVDVSGFFPERGLVEALVEDIGANHILFGSDVPIRSIESQLAKVLFAEIGAEQKQQILWKNAAGLLNLSGIPHDVTVEQETERWNEDHFCFCGRAPLFDHPCPSPAELQAVLERAGIDTGYAVGTDSLYSRDLVPHNSAFKEAAKDCTRVVPLATLDPSVPNWLLVLDHARQHFEGGFLSPYLHNWAVNDPACRPFFERCAKERFPLWINGCTADHRARHRGLDCRPVSSAELVDFAEHMPENEYVFQGLGKAEVNAVLEHANEQRHVRCDISRLTDRTGNLGQIIDKHGADKLVLGSEYPLRHIRTVRWCAACQAPAALTRPGYSTQMQTAAR